MDSAEFRTTFHRIAEPVTVTRFGKPIGRWFPEGSIPTLEVPMEDTVKKAIEPDKVKETGRGRPTKGLGEIPGVTGRPTAKDAQKSRDEILRRVNKGG